MLEVKDILTIILALYGAILSTILAVRETKKEKRNVQVFLEYLVFQDSYKLIVVNVGYRPITVIEGGVRLFNKKGFPIEQMPAPIFGENSNDEFLVLLNDGSQKTFVVSKALDNPTVIKENGWKVEAFVRDAEGKIYKTRKIHSYSSRIKEYV